MPRHANKERPVVTVVRGPPVLRRLHDTEYVPLDLLQIERVELFSVVCNTCRCTLRQRLQAELVGPPVCLGTRHFFRVHERALGYGSHGTILLLVFFFVIVFFAAFGYPVLGN